VSSKLKVVYDSYMSLKEQLRGKDLEISLLKSQLQRYAQNGKVRDSR
jgi:hypothetical protein